MHRREQSAKVRAYLMRRGMSAYICDSANRTNLEYEFHTDNAIRSGHNYASSRLSLQIRLLHEAKQMFPMQDAYMSLSVFRTTRIVTSLLRISNPTDRCTSGGKKNAP